MGGISVGVGVIVGVKVTVGVYVMVGVGVSVGVGVGVAVEVGIKVLMGSGTSLVGLSTMGTETPIAVQPLVKSRNNKINDSIVFLIITSSSSF
jgi:hypothetical protein